MKSTLLTNSQTDFVAQYGEGKKSFPPALNTLKENAISSLGQLGFPTTKNEEWKYTNVSGILKSNFLTPSKELKLTRNEIKYFLPEDSNSILFVFENGKLNKDLSLISSLPEGIIAGELNKYTDHEKVKKHLGEIAPHGSESFVALNTALFNHGVFVYADKNIICERPIHFLFINDARQFPTVSYPRLLVVADRGSSLKISESYFSVDGVNSSFCNPVTEIFIDDNATVEYCKNQSVNAVDFHIDYSGIRLRKDSKVTVHTVTSGGKMVRNNLRIELQDVNGSAYLNGLYITDGETHVDNHSLVDHASPNCYSNELYKGILNGRSHGIFNGKIFVRKDAQKTNAYQSNKNILLSDDASMYAKPQLEIYADDVKCSHGATTGQLDDEAMFYLRSRGIGENEARALLTNAFAEEILDRISIDSVKEKIKDQIHSKLMKGMA